MTTFYRVVQNGDWNDDSLNPATTENSALYLGRPNPNETVPKFWDIVQSSFYPPYLDSTTVAGPTLEKSLALPVPETDDADFSILRSVMRGPVSSASFRLDHYVTEATPSNETHVGFAREGTPFFEFRLMANTTSYVTLKVTRSAAGVVTTSGVRVVGGTPTTAFSTTYSATNHRYFKVTKSGSTITFYRSANGTSWTSLGSTTMSGWASDMDLYLELHGGHAASHDPFESFTRIRVVNMHVTQAPPVSVAPTITPLTQIVRRVEMVAQVATSALIPDVHRLTEKFLTLTASVSATPLMQKFRAIVLSKLVAATPTIKKSQRGVRVFINGAPVDGANVALPLRITHGRSDIGNQPDAPQCSFTYLGHVAPAAIGAPVLLYTDDTVRFKGQIVKMTAVERYGLVWGYSVECIGDLAQVGQKKVTISRNSESDVARVQAIATAAGFTVTCVGSTSGTATLRPDNIDKSALEAIHDVCKSSGGLFWQASNGDFIYGTMNHRSVDPVGLLPAHLIIDGLQWNNDLSTVVNHVTVKYTQYPNWPSVDGAVNNEDTYQDAASIALYGRRHVDLDSLGYDDIAAGVIGLMVLAARDRPRWRMPGVMLLVGKATTAEMDFVNSLDVSSVVFAPVENAPFDTPGNVEKWCVEGFVEEWSGGGEHSFQLALSEPGAVVVGLTWDMIDNHTYSEISNGTWLEMLIGVA